MFRIKLQIQNQMETAIDKIGTSTKRFENEI